MLVGALVTLLTLGVLQLGLVVYVRNVVHDAAVEGAYRAALADIPIADGVRRTGELILATVGDGYARSIAGRETVRAGQPVVEITVAATLPLLGLLGMPAALEVTGHAPAETFD